MKEEVKERIRKEIGYYKFGTHEKILIIILLLGVAIDFILSYITYLQRPEYFIENEQFREAVHFFADGVFPITTLFVVLVSIGVIMWILATSREIKDRLKLFPGWVKFESKIVGVLYLMFFVHLAKRTIGGMSWHVEHTDQYMMSYFATDFVWYLVGLGLATMMSIGIIKICYVEYKENKK